MAVLAKDNVLLVTRLDRLARSTRDPQRAGVVADKRAGATPNRSRCGVLRKSTISRKTGAPFLQDSSDRAGAQSAMHQAAEAIVDLRSRTQLDIRGDDGLSDVVIADDIARADDHSGCASSIRASCERPDCGKERRRQGAFDTSV
jgi:hypothetical protein